MKRGNWDGKIQEENIRKHKKTGFWMFLVLSRTSKLKIENSGAFDDSESTRQGVELGKSIPSDSAPLHSTHSPSIRIDGNILGQLKMEPKFGSGTFKVFKSL